MGRQASLHSMVQALGSLDNAADTTHGPSHCARTIDPVSRQHETPAGTTTRHAGSRMFRPADPAILQISLITSKAQICHTIRHGMTAGLGHRQVAGLAGGGQVTDSFASFNPQEGREI